MIARAYGLARSLVTYYGPVWRRARIAAFYGQFLRAGDLAFDVGAHVGSRVRAFRRLGARVVALEPQPDLVAVLRALYGRDPAVAIEPVAVGAATGRVELQISRASPTLSTIAAGWIDEVRADPRFAGARWGARLDVELTTLDALIARHGEPAFIKIDVEGAEKDVLDGLSCAPPALSFEYIPIAAARAIACVERVAALGDYRFRTSRVETMRWHGGWRDAAGITRDLAALSPDDRSGDVYAVRADRPRAPDDV